MMTERQYTVMHCAQQAGGGQVQQSVAAAGNVAAQRHEGAKSGSTARRSAPIMMGRNLRMALACCCDGSWLCCGEMTFMLTYCRPGRAGAGTRVGV